MKLLNNGMAVISLAIVSFLSLSAQALLIDDNYNGGGDKALAKYGLSRDVLGGDIFQVYSMDVTSSAGLMSVTIHTDFNETDPENIWGYEAGDLFISTDGWNPYAGTNYPGAPYYEDDASNGTTWEYAFDSSAETMLGITADDIDLIEEGECCRLGQEVLATGGTEVDGAAISYSGAVAVDGKDWAYEYTYVFDYSDLGLQNGDDIGLHWVMTCGNDVIEGMATINDQPSQDDGPVLVSEPGSVILLVVGFTALMLSRKS